MKTKALFLRISLVAICQNSLAQVVNCGNAHNYTPSQAPNCLNYLNEFIPVPTDPVLEVNVVFHILQPIGGGGVWAVPSNADITAILNDINLSYATIPLPFPANPNITNHIPHSKVKFVQKGNVNIIINNFFYNDPALIYFQNATQYIDPDAINVYYGSSNPSTINGAHSPFDGFVFFPYVSPNFAVNSPDGIKTLRHELAHALGLQNHTVSWDGGGYNSASVVGSCCTQVIAVDHYLELPSPNGVPITNNMVSKDGSSPFTYLSPQQMALIHYKLRTHNKRFLTTSSYNNDISRVSSSDYIIQTGGGQLWTQQDRYFKGNVIIKNGNKLRIWCKVGMTKGAHIIVEKGGQLIIEFGGEVTNISGQLWGGILVEGSSNLGQIVNANTGFATNQGVARVINGGKVSQAENGVKNYITDAQGGIDWNTRGGVIIGNGGIFENNMRDAEFISYQSPFGSDYSYFTNCSFKTTTDFNSINPPYAHITMWNTRGIGIKGCNFEYLAGNKYWWDHGLGIHTIDANFFVDKNGSTLNTFKALRQGVRVANSNPLHIANIKNTFFFRNQTDGAYFQNMYNFTFEKNDLQMITQVGVQSNGLYMNQCKNYKVKLNQFHEDPTMINNTQNGVWVYKSEGGAHEIYKNQFFNLLVGVNAMDKNSANITPDDGLKINCNDFSPALNLYDVALSWTHGLAAPTVKREQGNISAPTSTNVVRNIYNAACGNQNKWYIYYTSSKVVDHGSNSQSSTQMVSQPSCGSNLVNDVPSAISLIYNTHCKDNPLSSGGGGTTQAQRLANLDANLAYLLANNSNNKEYFEIQSTLAAKLEVFITDSLTSSQDSVISILETYPQFIQDADIQTVFAYMYKGNFSEAQAKINNLDSTRADWAALLTKLIEIEQDDNKIFSLLTNTSTVSFLENYASTNGKDGQIVAQSLLSFVLGNQYEVPRAVPVEGEGEGERRFSNTMVINQNEIFKSPSIKIFPNPSSESFNIERTGVIEGAIKLEVKDLLGKTLLSNTIPDFSYYSISLKEFSNGIYLLNVSNSKGEILFKEKLIKQD